MLDNFRELIFRSPVHFVARALYKLTLGRMKYARGGDYDAERYWTDRFSKFGSSLRGAGHEGLSEHANIERYTEAGQRFIQFCQQQDIEFANKRVLEIGCGTGYYTDLISKMAPVAEFTGIDITDILFASIESRHPTFRFIKLDVTEPRQDLGPFDVVVMIDVLEHIVTDCRFNNAMANIRQWLAPGGTVIISPIPASDSKALFYLRWWSLNSLEHVFQGYTFNQSDPFSGHHIVAVTSPKN